MGIKYRKIFVIADIEGSSGCFDYESSRFMGRGWPSACAAMSLDMDALVCALFEAGAVKVAIKDFHRTAYNLIRGMINPEAELISGYKRGPVPGIGDPSAYDCLMMTGMHGPSGTDAFLAHTMTSRIAWIKVNGRLLSEAELFSAAVAPYGLVPVFFSACPAACADVRDKIPGISTFPVDKKNPLYSPEKWRLEFAAAAVKSLEKDQYTPFLPEGVFSVEVSFKPGEDDPGKICLKYGYNCINGIIHFSAGSYAEIFYNLIRICYFTPAVEKFLSIGLPLYNMLGRAGLLWARLSLKNSCFPDKTSTN